MPLVCLQELMSGAVQDSKASNGFVLATKEVQSIKLSADARTSGTDSLSLALYFVISNRQHWHFCATLKEKVN